MSLNPFSLSRAYQTVKYDWSSQARPEQRLPADDKWIIWLYLAGRGTGKTLSGAQAVREWVETGKCKRIGLIAPTAADARDVVLEGKSGFLAICPPSNRPLFEPSKRRLTWPESNLPSSGAIATIYSAEEGDRLRGPEHDGLWCDELAAWKDAQHVWDMAMMGLRLGRQPRAIVTTTPRPLKIIRDLVSRNGKDVRVTRGSTFDNAKNLPSSFLEQLRSRYEGTRLGRQELYAEILDDMPGALWHFDQIDAARIKNPDIVPPLRRIVVAIDPAVSTKEKSDETGIIVAGIDDNKHAYVLDDKSGVYAPIEWARKAVEIYHLRAADRIVAEINNGGDMVEATVRSIDPTVAYRGVHATRGKAIRAEPVSSLYEQARVHHVGRFEALEDQMCSFTPDFDRAQNGSPDRVDALVWALSELMVSAQRPSLVFGALDRPDELETARRHLLRGYAAGY